MVAIVVATAQDSSALFVAGAFVAGAGFGVAFLSGLRQPAPNRMAITQRSGTVTFGYRWW